jgi:putative membrane protein
MDRRSFVAGLAGACLVLPADRVSAQGMDRMKMPILMGGDFATATSELALRRGSSRAVTQFARLEIAEQAAVARAFGSRPGAAGLMPEHAALLEQLRGARGARFDQAYLAGQIRGHEELLALHKRYARSGRDPTARGASIVGVTGIETHLVMLNAIARSV